MFEALVSQAMQALALALAVGLTRGLKRKAVESCEPLSVLEDARRLCAVPGEEARHTNGRKALPHDLGHA